MFAVVPMSAGEHLCQLQIPGAAHELGDRRVPCLVHRPMREVGPLEAFRPPAMHRRGGELLLAVAVSLCSRTPQAKKSRRTEITFASFARIASRAPAFRNDA
jgi:hypothetical protein